MSYKHNNVLVKLYMTYVISYMTRVPDTWTVTGKKSKALTIALCN